MTESDRQREWPDVGKQSQSCSLRHATYLIRCAPHRPAHRPRCRQQPVFLSSFSHTSLHPSPAHPWLLLIILIDYHIISLPLSFLPPIFVPSDSAIFSSPRIPCTTCPCPSLHLRLLNPTTRPHLATIQFILFFIFFIAGFIMDPTPFAFSFMRLHGRLRVVSSSLFPPRSRPYLALPSRLPVPAALVRPINGVH